MLDVDGSLVNRGLSGCLGRSPVSKIPANALPLAHRVFQSCRKQFDQSEQTTRGWQQQKVSVGGVADLQIAVVDVVDVMMERNQETELVDGIHPRPG